MHTNSIIANQKIGTTIKKQMIINAYAGALMETINFPLKSGVVKLKPTELN